MIKKIGTVLIITIIATTLFFTFTQLPEPFPASSESALWLQKGIDNVNKRDFILRDTTRKTQAHHTFMEFKGYPYRQFEITVWFPRNMNNRQHPLIVYSHGMASTRSDAAYIANHLSSHGYIVLAADYPLTNRSAPGGAFAPDVINQADDIKYLIDRILNTDNEMGNEFSQFIDPEKIGSMGISLGGVATTLITYHPQMRDIRIKAAVSIAGASAMFGEKLYKNSATPFLMIAGELDAVLPYKDHAKPIPKRIANSLLVSVKGGSHLGFIDGAKYMRWMNNPDSLGCYLINLADRTSEKSWYPQFGTAEQGIIYDDPSAGCLENQILPKAINPLKQHMITQVATLSFFEGVFNDKAAARKSAKLFLNETLAREIKFVEVSQSKVKAF